MSSNHSVSSSSDFISKEISSVILGDRRLVARAAKVISHMERAPDKSLNSTFNGAIDTQAAYRFFENENVSAKAMIEAHRPPTIGRCEAHDLLLLAQDTSELDFSSNTTLKGAGIISQNQNSHRTGFFLHARYLLGGNHVPLGIWGMDFGVRDPKDRGKAKAREKLPIEEKSSFRWLAGYREACEIQARFPDKQVVSLADRESDIYEIYLEHLECTEAGGTPADFVIRAKENRRLLKTDPRSGKPEKTVSHLFDEDALHPPLGRITFEVPTRTKTYRPKGTTSNKTYLRKARTVTQEVRAYQVVLHPPYRFGKRLPPLSVWIVSAKEIDPPEGEPPVQWILLTSIAVRTLEQAQAVVGHYLGRWQIEVFFRTLKTGCRIEKILLKKANALQTCIALYGIVAWRLNYLTDHARVSGESPCCEYFSEEEWRSTLLMAEPGRRDHEPVSLKDFMTKVAVLGGYANRKSDPPPGPKPSGRACKKSFTTQGFGKRSTATIQKPDLCVKLSAALHPVLRSVHPSGIKEADFHAGFHKS